MASSSWRNVATALAGELIYQQCTDHRDLVEDCPACADRAAMNAYRAASTADTQRRRTPAEWQQVAYVLGARMHVHANACTDHPKQLQPYGTCPFCDETRAWRLFEKKATAEGLRLPDQDHHDMLDAARPLNVFDVPGMEDHRR
jgi:sarcosine oxidase delta subunit